MNLDITIQIPELWGKNVFRKKHWGHINFIIGPNGTGKTWFGKVLLSQCKSNGLKPKLLSTQRLMGVEDDRSFLMKETYHERDGLDISYLAERHKKLGEIDDGVAAMALYILKEKIDIRTKIEACLSQLLQTSIRLDEESGFLKPTLINWVVGASH